MVILLTTIKLLFCCYGLLNINLYYNPWIWCYHPTVDATWEPHESLMLNINYLLLSSVQHLVNIPVHFNLLLPNLLTHCNPKSQESGPGTS